MHHYLTNLNEEILTLKQQVDKLTKKFACPDNPLAYAKQKGWLLTPQQQEIMRACVQPPYSVLIKSAHSTGKTFTLACIANWFYDYYQEDGMVLCTAPVFQQVKDLLFKELRRLRPNDPDWLPRATRLQTSDRHAIIGFTANNPTSFQGRHSQHMCILFDEAAGIESCYFDRMRSMCENNRKGHLFVGAFNPYDISSPVYGEENSGRHTVLQLTAMEHPNVIHRTNIIDGAIAYTTVKDRVHAECRELQEGEDLSRAFKFDDKYWYTDSALFEVQILGMYPTRAINSVWSLQSIELLNQPKTILPDHLCQIGVDLAQFGDDRTTICIRKGYSVIHMESHHGWTLKRTSRKVQELAEKYSHKGQPAVKMPVVYDSCGLGAGFGDHNMLGHNKFTYIPVNSSMKSFYEGQYPNIRSELWLETASLAADGHIGLSKDIPEDVRKELTNDLLSPVYSMDNLGRMVVEAKKLTKQRLKHSPDLADAFNLCYYQPPKNMAERVMGRV